MKQPQDFSIFLEKDGWKTPDTYAGFFEELPAASGIYLFLCFNFKLIPQDPKNIKIGYVGSSKNIMRRLSFHPVYQQITNDGFWPQRWFRIEPKEKIREIEKKYIYEFNPPYNIIGRPRGGM